MHIGVMGLGVVGRAVYDYFNITNTLKSTYGWDIVNTRSIDTFDHIISCDVVFVSVPTPTSKFQQDLSALRSALSSLSSKNYGGVVAIKSTILPGTTDRLSIDFPKLRLVHQPEFLTASKPFKDFACQQCIIVGGDATNTAVVKRAYEMCGFSGRVKEFASAKITEMSKYIHNVFLAAKVTFCNDIYEICQDQNIDYNEAMDGAISQGGVGAGHTKVPGTDGQLGYSGMCFPKDVTAFYNWAKSLGLPVQMVEATFSANYPRRPDDMTKQIS